MANLASLLEDWVDFDVAQWHLAVILGLWDEDGNPPGPSYVSDDCHDNWKGHKGTIWSNTPIGRALGETLLTMVQHGLLEKNDEMQIRWAGLKE